jgi:hypothetical protein
LIRLRGWPLVLSNDADATPRGERERSQPGTDLDDDVACADTGRADDPADKACAQG